MYRYGFVQAYLDYFGTDRPSLHSFVSVPSTSRYVTRKVNPYAVQTIKVSQALLINTWHFWESCLVSCVCSCLPAVACIEQTGGLTGLYVVWATPTDVS